MQDGPVGRDVRAEWPLIGRRDWVPGELTPWRYLLALVAAPLACAGLVTGFALGTPALWLPSLAMLAVSHTVLQLAAARLCRVFERPDANTYWRMSLAVLWLHLGGAVPQARRSLTRG